MNIQERMPDAWRVFFRHRTLRPIQENAALPLLRGASALLSAPTAAGKTEAVFAPLYQRHVSFRRAHTSVIYVAPTKALVNDMFERLTTYFAESPDGVVSRYTGDHHGFNTPDGGFVVLATPEALDSLQLMRPELVANARAVICDELHLLHGTARGQQMRAVLSRVRHQSKVPRDPRDAFQVVGTTATMRDAADVARLWCGVDGTVVSGGEKREIDLQVIHTAGVDAARELTRRIQREEAKKLLVFANSRNGAHELAARLDSELRPAGWPTYLHIGILSASERERVESAMKNERRGVCVATSTLEVGIDIGDVDVVVLADPPGTVSGFMQRVGRGNRRSDRCVVWALVETSFQQRLVEALHSCAVDGNLDDVHEYDRPSVHFQQILSAAWIGMRRDRPLTRQRFEAMTGGCADPNVLDDMVATGVLQEVRGALVPSHEWCDLGDERRIHSVIVGSPGAPVVDVHSGEVVGHGVDASQANGMLFAGGGLRRVYGGDEEGIYVGPAGAGRGALLRLPTARGGKRGLSRQVVHAMARSWGQDPSQWRTEAGRLVTWGGDRYNMLLAAVLSAAGRSKVLKPDAFGIAGFDVGDDVGPDEAATIAKHVLERRTLPDRLTSKFREGTAFLRALSSQLQQEESRRALPESGFLNWLGECSAGESSALAEPNSPQDTL